MTTIDGQKIKLVTTDCSQFTTVRAIVGGSVVWAEQFTVGENGERMKPSAARKEARRCLEKMGIIQDGE